MKKGLKDLKRFLYFLGFLSSLHLLYLAFLPIHRLEDLKDSGFQIYSSEGRVLRETQGDSGYIGYQPISEFPEFLIQSTLRVEDSRFYSMPGVDFLSILRAIGQNLRNGKIISGASTIHQQVARIVLRNQLSSNVWIRKYEEFYLAIYLNFRYTKEEILEVYLNRVPLKDNISGFPSGSRILLNTDLHFLTPEQSLLLVSLIKKPNAKPQELEKRYEYLRVQYFPECKSEISHHLESVFQRNLKNGNQNPLTLHYVDWIQSRSLHPKGIFSSEFSEELSRKIYGILQKEFPVLERYNAENSSVIVLKRSGDTKNPKLSLVSLIGSRNYLNEKEGQVNGALAIRNSGSTLKPFLYGLAMEKFGWFPNQILQDIEVSSLGKDGEVYRPQNNDLSYWGQMTLREALSFSRNAPAIRTIEVLGIEKFYLFLKSAGYDHLEKPASYYGPGLALGSGGSRLLDLTRLYSSLLTDGILYPIYLGKENGKEMYYGTKTTLLNPQTAQILTDVLSDREIRRRAFGKRNFLDFPFDVASKTGTSKDYRDSWTVGYNSDYVVGVWVGNFSGEQMKRVSGSVGAGRIFQNILRILPHSKKHFTLSEGLEKRTLCRITGKSPTPNCPTYREVLPVSLTPETCDTSHEISGKERFFSDRIIPGVLSPAPGEIFYIDSSLPQENQEIPIRIEYSSDRSEHRFSYKINGSERKMIEESIETTLPLLQGKYNFQLMRDEEVIQEYSFLVRQSL